MMQRVYPKVRLRRLRQSPKFRSLVREVNLTSSKLVAPLFITYGDKIKTEINSMPGQFRFSIDMLEAEVSELYDLGIRAVLLFGVPEHKDIDGTLSCAEDGLIQTAIKKIKAANADILIIADVCLCEYTEHGHCGVISFDQNQEHQIDNDSTLKVLSKQALSFARAGADIVAPSAMMDGMVHSIRTYLDANGFTQLPILSYAVKFASSLYGPFRDAANGVPKFGDRSSYQLDPACESQALQEAMLDINEGADILMVKPAGMYLDILSKVKGKYPEIPIAAYQVSGEYAMILLAAKHGVLNFEEAMIESLVAIKRAGADFVITYFAKEAAKLINHLT